jgi:hypothetical protein
MWQTGRMQCRDTARFELLCDSVCLWWESRYISITSYSNDLFICILVAPPAPPTLCAGGFANMIFPHSFSAMIWKLSYLCGYVRMRLGPGVWLDDDDDDLAVLLKHKGLHHKCPCSF